MGATQIASASYDHLEGHKKKHDLPPASPDYQLTDVTLKQVRFR